MCGVGNLIESIEYLKLELTNDPQIGVEPPVVEELASAVSDLEEGEIVDDDDGVIVVDDNKGEGDVIFFGASSSTKISAAPPLCDRAKQIMYKCNAALSSKPPDEPNSSKRNIWDMNGNNEKFARCSEILSASNSVVTGDFVDGSLGVVPARERPASVQPSRTTERLHPLPMLAFRHKSAILQFAELATKAFREVGGLYKLREDPKLLQVKDIIEAVLGYTGRKKNVRNSTFVSDARKVIKMAAELRNEEKMENQKKKTQRLIGKAQKSLEALKAQAARPKPIADLASVTNLPTYKAPQLLASKPRDTFEGRSRNMQTFCKNPNLDVRLPTAQFQPLSAPFFFPFHPAPTPSCQQTAVPLMTSSIFIPNARSMLLQGSASSFGTCDQSMPSEGASGARTNSGSSGVSAATIPGPVPLSTLPSSVSTPQMFVNRPLPSSDDDFLPIPPRRFDDVPIHLERAPLSVHHDFGTSQSPPVPFRIRLHVNRHFQFN